MRVRLWDEALAGARACLREAGLREVSTPIRVDAPALEPWIEPIGAGPDHWLATSPELAMKRLLCRGAGSIFQLAHVFRAGEVGARHREEFHLLEWYREPGELLGVMGDVERVVERIFALARAVVGTKGPPAPREWRRVEMIDLLRETTGIHLVGDEPAATIEPLLVHARARAQVRWVERGGERTTSDELADLLAWTELFSLWSDLELDPWLARQDPTIGVHVVGFPRMLAALAEVEGARAQRFESHVFGVELANGYLELRDAVEQRRRFERVAALRAYHGLAALPLPEAFLAALADEGLPRCAGVALGFDRLLALATGSDSLDRFALA
ncbi:amino acid--tRNA ligase-related protein [Nannocystaceae bacterium ST9]